MSVDWSQVTWFSRGRKIASGPSVSINKGGRVVLNDEALSLIGNPDAIQVGVHQGSRGRVNLILQAAAPSDAGSLKLSKQGAKRSLNTSRFLTELGLDKHFATDDHTPSLDEDHNALIVNL